MLSQPWFSRKQLNIIIVVTTLAIAILSTTGPDPLPTAKRYENAGVPALFLANNNEVGRLRFSFALPANGHSSQFMPQLVYQLVVNRLKERGISPETGWPPLSLNLQHDRIQLQVNAKQVPEVEQLSQLMGWLSEDFSPETWYELAKRLQADRYIQHASEPSALYQIAPLIGLTQAGNSDEIDFTYQQALFSAKNVSISYVGPEADAWVAMAVTAANQLPSNTSTPSSPVIWPYPNKQIRPLKGYMSVLATQTPGVNSPQTALERAAVELILKFRGNTYNGDWQTQQGSGLLLLSSQQLGAAKLLDQLRLKIEQLDQAIVQSIADDQVDRLTSLPEKPEQLLNYLESISFYHLPVDYLPSLETSLKELDPKMIRNKALTLLVEDDFYWVTRQ